MAAKTFDIHTFAIDVYSWRVERKLSRLKVSEMIGAKGDSAISNIEANKHTPNVSLIFNICELIGQTIDKYMK